MKKNILFAIFAFLSVSSLGSLNAGIVGDINNDGTIDVTEAIYALQVSAGVYTSLDPSCLLVGKGSWSAGEDYNPCDVVQYGGLSYACTVAHTSEAGTSDPTDAIYWTPLTLEGPAGSPGTDGEDGTNGSDGSNGKSAYQIAVDGGYAGTEAEWVTSHSKVLMALMAPMALMALMAPMVLTVSVLLVQ